MGVAVQRLKYRFHLISFQASNDQRAIKKNVKFQKDFKVMVFSKLLIKNLKLFSKIDCAPNQYCQQDGTIP